MLKRVVAIAGLSGTKSAAGQGNADPAPYPRQADDRKRSLEYRNGLGGKDGAAGTTGEYCATATAAVRTMHRSRESNANGAANLLVAALVAKVHCAGGDETVVRAGSDSASGCRGRLARMRPAR